MEFWKIIKEHNKEVLATQIRANGGTCENSVESIIANMRYLAETGLSYGEETKFIRLNILRAIASLNDEGRIIFKPVNVTWADDKRAVVVGGYLYEIKEDGSEKIISSYTSGGAYIEDVYAREEMEDTKRYASMVSFASARAEKNALCNAGIGIEFKDNDTFDLERLEAMIPATEPVLPTPASQEERKKRGRKPKAQATTETPVTVEEIDNPTPAVEEKEINTPVLSVESGANVSSMTYEEACKVPVDVGNYAEKKDKDTGEVTPALTIGEVLAKPQTARNIPWCYKQNVEGRSEKTKEAYRVAIENYDGGSLKRFL